MLGSSASFHKTVFCVILMSEYSTAVLEKYWLPDLEWRTASNWADGHIPDIDSHVIFPEQTRHAVGIAAASDLRLSEIDLPRQGLLALPRTGKLQVRAVYWLVEKYEKRRLLEQIERARGGKNNTFSPSFFTFDANRKYSFMEYWWQLLRYRSVIIALLIFQCRCAVCYLVNWKIQLIRIFIRW